MLSLSPTNQIHPKGKMGKKIPMRLSYLRVNPQKIAKATAPCAEELQTLSACWRLNGVDAGACVGVMAALTACTASKSKAGSVHQCKPSVNYRLNKMFSLRNQ